jgi:glycosyltransferase involved in cell wall biosynthesis
MSGGVQSVVIGMAHALSQFENPDEEYLFLAWPDHAEWIKPYLSGPCRILLAPPSPADKAADWLKRNVPIAKTAWATLSAPFGRYLYRVSRSGGTVEQADVDVMHFTIQTGFRTGVPSIYHPHDLQHRHLPEYFSARDRAYRDLVYSALCSQAEMIAVTSSWVKRDIVEQFGVAEEKVEVVPLAPVLTAYPEPSRHELNQTKVKLSLPDRFVLYPAQTWPHKNHLRLIEAIARLRDTTGVEVSLVCCGGTTEFYGSVAAEVDRLRLRDQVRFVGFVSPLELQALYRLATAVVIPTKFEAASGPLWDAFLSGVPAACSTVTSLPEQAGDAALLFDPDSPEQIADAIQRLWTDAALRQTLADRGRANVSRFTWERTAHHFRAHYRRIAGRRLTDEDVELLSAPPLL